MSMTDRNIGIAWSDEFQMQPYDLDLFSRIVDSISQRLEQVDCALCHRSLNGRIRMRIIENRQFEIATDVQEGDTPRMPNYRNLDVCYECAMRYRYEYERRQHMVLGRMELKGEDLFIWDPESIELKRIYGRQTSLDINIKGEIEGFNNTFVGRRITKMFIKDGDTVWIGRHCQVIQYSSAHHTDSMGYEIRISIHCERLHFMPESQARQEQQPPFSQQFDDENQVVVYCSCGFADKTSIHTELYSHMNYAVSNISSIEPGGSMTHDFTEDPDYLGSHRTRHSITFRRGTRTIARPLGAEFEDLR